MNERLTGPFRHVLGKVTRRGNRAAVLTYHRIAGLSADPQLLSVTPDHFEEQLAHITSRYTSVSLSELAGAINAGDVPDRAIAVTFDDGYRDNYAMGLPLLKNYKVPATVFVTTDFIGQDREFWWDDLERIMLLSHDLPETLDIVIRGRRHRWTFGKASARNLMGDKRWDVTMRTDPTPYNGVYRELHTLLKPLGHSERMPVMEELCRWAGIPAAGRPENRVMSDDEIRKLAAGGLVEVGSHTVTHPVLAAMSWEAQTTELTESKKRLEAILGHNVSGLSYPFGAPSDIGDIASRIACEAGYSWACANFCGLADARTDTFMMPRLLVRDWDGRTFARRLRGWFDGT